MALMVMLATKSDLYHSNILMVLYLSLMVQRERCSEYDPDSRNLKIWIFVIVVDSLDFKKISCTKIVVIGEIIWLVTDVVSRRKTIGFLDWLVENDENGPVSNEFQVDIDPFKLLYIPSP